MSLFFLEDSQRALSGAVEEDHPTQLVSKLFAAALVACRNSHIHIISPSLPHIYLLRLLVFALVLS